METVTYYILISTNSSGSAEITKYTNQEGTETEQITIPAGSTDYKVDGLMYGFRFFISDSDYITKLDTTYLNTSNIMNMHSMFAGCELLTHIKYKRAFKNWCWANQNDISLPTAMRSGGSGRWEIVG